MGRVFMHPELDDPFQAGERELAACPLGEQADAVVIDFHAEATSEKMCFAHFVDGRASLVVGTHTHQPTADHQILNGGTAYLTDAGMCGDYDSSLGMDKEEPLNRFLSKVPKGRFEAANGPATICGVGVDISDRTGLAERIAPLRRGPRLEETVAFLLVVVHDPEPKVRVAKIGSILLPGWRDDPCGRWQARCGSVGRHRVTKWVSASWKPIVSAEFSSLSH